MTAHRILISALLLAGVGGAAQAQDVAYGYAAPSYDTDGQSVDSVAVFFEPLSHYGRWLDSRYGRVWTPNVGRDWRPYTIGHWEAGPFGQTWRSDEPFGWAVFHFGRWAFDPAIGWVWSPDTVWGPAWVAWRDGDDVTGWAPLPPQVDVLFAGNFGFNDWGYDQWYQPAWVYVPRGYLYARSLRGAYLPYGRNHDLWERTRGITRYDRQNGQVVNRSFDDGRNGLDRRDGRRDEGRRDEGRRDEGRRDNGRRDDGRRDDGRRDDGRRDDGRRDDGGRPDLRTTQGYAAAPAPAGGAPLARGDAHGFVPLPRGYGGFVPGAPRGGYRPALPPVAAVPHAGAPMIRGAPPTPGLPPPRLATPLTIPTRPAMPMPMARPAMPMPAPRPAPLPPAAPRGEDRHH